MTRGKIPPATALVPWGGPPDAALINHLRLAHWRDKGRLETAVALLVERGAPPKLTYDRPAMVDAGASYLVADMATYEIVCALRANRYFLAKDKALAPGGHYLLIPMGNA